MSSLPPPNSDNSGWYAPIERPYPTLPDFQEFENMTDPFLTVQITDALHDLWSEMPIMYAESLRMGGEDVVWLSRLTTGTRCRNWNGTSHQENASKCPYCYGTGFEGGYQSARRIRVSFEPGKSDVEIQQLGLTVDQKPTAWTTPTNPTIKSFDIIVNYQNERYIVTAVRIKEEQGRRMYQELTLTRPDRFSVEYSVPVPGVNGDADKDFNATLTINIPRTAPTIAEFPAMLLINNYYWSDSGQ